MCYSTVAGEETRKPGMLALIANLHRHGWWFVNLGCLFAWGCLSVGYATAQDVRIVQQRGPYYVDDPMVVQIQVGSVDAGRDVTCRYSGDAIDGLAVAGPQVSQSSSSFTQIINGRVTSSESVSYKFSFQVQASRQGSFSVGPFVVDIDGREQVIDGPEIEFGQLEDDPDMELDISIPRNKIYVGETVPVVIRWAFAGDRDSLQYAFSNLQIRSPLFDQFEFADKPPATRTTLSISTAQGNVEIDAQVSQERRNNREFVVVTGERAMIANSPGDFRSIPATCRTQRVTSWGRDFFGDVRPRGAKPALASAEPLNFTVSPLPTEGRPASFSGAVGSGFTIEVAANRSVVRVGDPISLDITLKGDGNIEKLALPSLAAGLDESQFQLPSESPSGSFAGNAKQFKVNVRVKNKDVDQLPAIPFSWFDPLQEKFETTTSKPIALQVLEAQVVSANEVVSARSSEPSSGPSTNQESQAANTTTSLNFMGANLAIEKELPLLLSSSVTRSGEQWMLAATYVLGFASILVALVIRRRGQASPVQTQQKVLLKQARKQIGESSSLPLRESARHIADGLRRLIAAFPDGDRKQADGVIAECESLIYALDDRGTAQAKDELVRRALSAAEQLAAGKR
jgi:hypothetical protein